MRLRSNDQTQAEIFIDGSLVATVPMWQIEQLVDEKKKIEARKLGPDDVVMASPVNPPRIRLDGGGNVG